MLVVSRYPQRPEEEIVNLAQLFSRLTIDRWARYFVSVRRVAVNAVVLFERVTSASRDRISVRHADARIHLFIVIGAEYLLTTQLRKALFDYRALLRLWVKVVLEAVEVVFIDIVEHFIFSHDAIVRRISLKSSVIVLGRFISDQRLCNRRPGCRPRLA